MLELTPSTFNHKLLNTRDVFKVINNQFSFLSLGLHLRFHLHLREHIIYSTYLIACLDGEGKEGE